ncbi:hypothetical protein ElyMa_000314900 [Elysia marginata]|uniref:Uncharacterized protein n=1 Tax=Elysia marginata TaxID=1093978 RepID=A0AAV4FAF7_9GAST|nr:hypothetical protein ElyMa_000314900 [Elysia marginata]
MPVGQNVNKLVHEISNDLSPFVKNDGVRTTRLLVPELSVYHSTGRNGHGDDNVGDYDDDGDDDDDGVVDNNDDDNGGDVKDDNFVYQNNDIYNDDYDKNDDDGFQDFVTRKPK